MPYTRAIIPTVPASTITGITAAVPYFGTVTGQTNGQSGVAFNYVPYLERISNALENLCETTYIFAGLFTPVQPLTALASVSGTVSGSLITGLPAASVALMKPGMILTNLADAPAQNTGWFGGLTKIATVNSATSIVISSQFPNNDGPITFMAGGYGTMVCTSPIPVAQAEPRPGMILSGSGVVPGQFIIDYIVPGTPNAFYVSVPQKGVVALVAAAGGFSAMAHSINTLEASVSGLLNMGNNQGIHTVDPYTLVEKATQYSYIKQNSAQLSQLAQDLQNLPATLGAIKDALKGVTKLP